MLDKPFAGWTNISFANKKIYGSYLTDIPLDFIEAINNVIELNKIQTVIIDSESKGEFIYVFNQFRSYIIEECSEDGNPNIYYEERNILDIANELAIDIEKHFESWQKWNPEIDESEMDIEEQKLFIIEMEKRKNIFESFIKKYKK
jgi:hypothetical protein